MANKYWVGGAEAVKQVTTAQVTADDAATTYKVTIGGVTVSTAGSGTGVNDTATAIKNSLEASTHPYFTNIDWTVATDTITGTAGTAGVPFTFTTSVTGGTGTFGAASTTTSNAGPNVWGTADNWSDGSAPGASDNVVIDRGPAILWDLDQSSITLGTLEVKQTFTGWIGLHPENFVTSANGQTTDTSVDDYRDDYLHIKMSTLKIGEHSGPGSPGGCRRLKIDLDSTAATVTVFNSASSSQDSHRPAIRLKANSASTNIHVRRAPGGLGIASDKPQETSTVGTVSIGEESSATSVYISSGVTITTFQQYAGENILNMAATITTVDVFGGTLTVEGSQLITTANVNGGTVYLNNTDGSGDSVTTLNLNAGTVDMTQATVERDLTTVNAKPNSILKVNHTVDVGTLNAELPFTYEF